MSWFRREAQPKDEHPCKGEWDAIAEQQDAHKHPLLKRPSNPELDVVYGKKMDPPQGGSVIARYRSPVVSAPRANPSIITEYGKLPRPRVDPDLIGDYYL